MKTLQFLIFACLCATILATRTVKYARNGPPKNSPWTILEDAHDDAEVTFTIALKHRNLDLLEKKLLEDSDPDSPVYAKHMSKDDILDMIAPSPAVQQKVIHWIKSEAAALGFASPVIVNYKDAIKVTSKVALVEKLFDTNMVKFYNTEKKAKVIKHIGKLSIPNHIAPHVDLVTGITELPPTDLPFVSNKNRQTKVQQSKKQQVTNACNVPYNLKNLYNWPLDLYVTNPHANLSIYAEQSVGTVDGFGFASVEYFDTANNVPKNAITCILGTGADDYNQNDDDAEAQLDTQVTSGMAPAAPTCFYLMDYGQGWMYEFANYILHTPGAPIVVSMSYGWVEVEQCIDDTIPFVGNCSYYHIPNSQDYIARTNVEFMKLGLAGFTLLAASGDDGTAGTHGSPDNCATLGPIYPAASPYVTTVGATSIENSSANPKKAKDLPPICTDTNTYNCACSTSTNEQIAFQTNSAGFDTGGGFSLYSPAGSWQTNAIQEYIKSGVALPPSNLFNASNRGFPDIGAVGENICVLDPGSPCSLIGGTSASCPLIASLVTLLNNDRLNAGKTTLGFFNPLIYKMYALNRGRFFNTNYSITTQTNAGECDPSHGFAPSPKKGVWNPLVGVGSPNFGEIRKYVATLP